MRRNLYLLFSLICCIACESNLLNTNPERIEGHWYGFAPNGRYYELLIDSSKIAHFESYRVNDAFFNFPESEIGYVKVENNLWRIYFFDDNYVHLKLKNDTTLHVFDPDTNEILENLSQISQQTQTESPYSGSIQATHEFRVQFIEREVNKLAHTQDLTADHKVHLLDSLLYAEELLINYYPDTLQ